MSTKYTSISKHDLVDADSPDGQYARAELDRRDKMSLPEKQFEQSGIYLLAERISRPIVYLHYEPFSFVIPSGRYTPDFLAIDSLGQHHFVETKEDVRDRRGKKVMVAGYRDSRVRWTECAEIFAMYHFWWFSYSRRSGSWDIEEHTPSGVNWRNCYVSTTAT